MVTSSTISLKSKIQECTFEIVASELDPDQVSALFRVEPGRVARRGDKARGKASYVQGHWVISSTSLVGSVEPEADEHLAAIVAFAVEHRKEIEALRKSVDVKVGIRLLWEFDNATVVFGLDREKLSNLADIIDWIGFSIT